MDMVWFDFIIFTLSFILFVEVDLSDLNSFYNFLFNDLIDNIPPFNFLGFLDGAIEILHILAPAVDLGAMLREIFGLR
ncbi:hypothetical protein M011DRAFT_474393 [Sporormia fimetaria CBS 119925]|uniref:Uncharacterized protein n=1 Tax=Sporormia fimetaria CBS 119925 TaxID=1340428 RepID=A0A6A6VJY8_9PLEO|nr:hypothetical protein M011DRAFT_474393 [Sporormia fimetaria CBS 119925]